MRPLVKPVRHKLLNARTRNYPDASEDRLPSNFNGCPAMRDGLAIGGQSPTNAPPTRQPPSVVVCMFVGRWRQHYQFRFGEFGDPEPRFDDDGVFRQPAD